MEYIKISIKDKIATAPQDALIVCGNSDYFVEFEFDDEWENSNIKTARFYYNFCHQDIVFEGNICQVPVLAETQLLKVGVFTDNVMTTTDAEIKCEYSIKKYGGNIITPTEDVYAQIMELLNKYIQGGGSSGGGGSSPTIDKEQIIKIIEEYLAEHPMGDGVSPTIEVENIENGYKITITDKNGEKSFNLLNGKDGKDGLTPYIGENGNWFIGEEDTSVNASGIVPPPIKERVEIASSLWSQLPNSQPFFYSAKVMVGTPLNDEARVSIANTDPIFFANFGLALAEINGQELTIYATNVPVGDTTITVLIDTKPKGRDVEIMVAPSMWTVLNNSQPFNYQAVVNVSGGIGNDAIVTLINDNPVLFATYGFVLASATNKEVTLYATTLPVGEIKLTINLEV